jgi:hypothetical protein
MIVTPELVALVGHAPTTIYAVDDDRGDDADETVQEGVPA